MVRNPTRRSRTIGTASQGYKKRLPFGIAKPAGDARFYERLVNPRALEFQLGRHSFSILVEPTAPGFHYYLSVADVHEALKLIPEKERKAVDMIVFRQPKTKERIFSEVWGRMAYWSEIGNRSGGLVQIEAIPDNYTYSVGNHAGPVFARELAALQQDGHEVCVNGRKIEITCSPQAIRNTQLFRTLPHEIGHHVDYMRRVEDAAEYGSDEYEALRELYFARPTREREDFADRYAREIFEPFRANAIIPYPPILDPAEQDVDPAWFYFATPRTV